MNRDPYRRIVKLYDPLIEPFMRSLRRNSMNLYPPRHGMCVLEIGCGTGTFLKLYQQAGCRVCGLDRSLAMVKAARRKLPESATVVHGDGHCLPFTEAAFDRIILSMVLHELDPEARPAVVAEAWRVLKPVGHLIILEYRPECLRIPPLFDARSFVHLIEFAAGRRHFRNFRHFLAAGGLTVLLGRDRWRIESQKSAAGGRIGIYGMRRRAFR